MDLVLCLVHVIRRELPHGAFTMPKGSLSVNLDNLSTESRDARTRCCFATFQLERRLGGPPANVHTTQNGPIRRQSQLRPAPEADVRVSLSRQLSPSRQTLTYEGLFTFFFFFLVVHPAVAGTNFKLLYTLARKLADSFGKKANQTMVRLWKPYFVTEQINEDVYKYFVRR